MKLELTSREWLRIRMALEEDCAQRRAKAERLGNALLVEHVDINERIIAAIDEASKP